MPNYDPMMKESTDIFSLRVGSCASIRMHRLPLLTDDDRHLCSLMRNRSLSRCRLA